MYALADIKWTLYIVLLNFSKAFGKVPNQRLLYKLDYYWVRGETYNGRKHSLAAENNEYFCTESPPHKLMPKGTVNGVLYLLRFFNDLPECTTSVTRLFADDGMLFKHIKSDKDAALL